MNWIELMVHTTTAGSDPVSEILMQHGATGTMIEDRADIPDPSKPHGIWEIIDPALLDAMPEDVMVHAWFEQSPSFSAVLKDIQDKLNRLSADSSDFGTLATDTRIVCDDEWKETWKQYFKPFHVGKNIVVKPTWESYEPLPDDRMIVIDPGMAFGSGTHETTSMCITLLEEYLRGGETVIDVGTGSGILAIAAALCNAGKILAIDIDPDAVRVARENVERNQVADRIEVVQGDLLKNTDAVCDICVANIISDIIIGFASPLCRHIRPDGLLICSGIVRQRGDEVRQALESAGYIILREEHKGEWVAFVGRRP